MEKTWISLEHISYDGENPEIENHQGYFGLISPSYDKYPGLISPCLHMGCENGVSCGMLIGVGIHHCLKVCGNDWGFHYCVKFFLVMCSVVVWHCHVCFTCFQLFSACLFFVMFFFYHD